MRFIELFAGIGGFRLGLEPLGWRCVWANEIDPYACKVYRKNFGDKELYEGDIREIDPKIIPDFDMLTAGFPCQDISVAGKGEGITKLNRSGLFYEIIRIVKDRLPRWIFLENVPALLIQGRGMDVVLRELSSCGYDAQWDCIPASAVGAPHKRDRIWIVAYPRNTSGRDNKQESHKRTGEGKVEKEKRGIETIKTSRSSPQRDSEPRHLDRNTESDDRKAIREIQEGKIAESRGICRDVSNATSKQTDRIFEQGIQRHIGTADSKKSQTLSIFGRKITRHSIWAVEPDVGRVAYGIPSRNDRLRCLGNSVVPQVVTHVGMCIQKYIDEL